MRQCARARYGLSLIHILITHENERTHSRAGVRPLLRIGDMTNQQLTLSWAAKSGEYPLPEAYNGAGVANEPNCEDRLEIRLRVNAFGVIESAGFSLTESACPPMWACAVYALSLIHI